MATTRVIVTDHFRQYEDQLERAVKHSMGKAAAIGVASARAKETKVKTGKTRASIRVLEPVTRNPRGWYMSYGSDWYVARFIEKGTRAKKGRAKTARTKARRAAAGVHHGGVKGIAFLRRSARDVRTALPELIEREMRLH